MIETKKNKKAKYLNKYNVTRSCSKYIKKECNLHMEIGSGLSKFIPN